MAKNQKTKKTKPRKIKEGSYKSFKLSKKIKPASKPLPGFFGLFRKSLEVLKNNKALFGGIIIINSLLGLLFVNGLGSSLDFVQTKNEIEEFIGGEAGQWSVTLTLFGYLIDSTGSQVGEIAGAYQMFFTLITSLAIIWAIRQVLVGEKVSAKEAYYKGLYPLIPFMLVLLVICLQLLPAVIGATIYNIIISGGLAVTALENALWLILFIMLCLLSFYMILSSVFALYIVTLPGMTPLKALRSARKVVIHRRLSISLRIIALLLVLVLSVLLIVFPAIIFLPWLAMTVFLLFSSLCLYLVHSYMYHLYRSLL
jgi:hypothetical protein